MKKLLGRFAKALSWTLFSCITTIIVAGATIQDIGFAIQYACMVSPLIALVSLGLIPVYVAHEYVWDVKGEEHDYHRRGRDYSGHRLRYPIRLHSLTPYRLSESESDPGLRDT